MLTLAELGTVLGSARRSLFRLETLDRYEMASDGSDFRRYLLNTTATWHDGRYQVR